MEEEREEGDITKLHLKLGLSPLDSPSTFSGIPGRLRSSGEVLQ